MPLDEIISSKECPCGQGSYQRIKKQLNSKTRIDYSIYCDNCETENIFEETEKGIWFIPKQEYENFQEFKKRLEGLNKNLLRIAKSNYFDTFVLYIASEKTKISAYKKLNGIVHKSLNKFRKEYDYAKSKESLEEYFNLQNMRQIIPMVKPKSNWLEVALDKVEQRKELIEERREELYSISEFMN